MGVLMKLERSGLLIMILLGGLASAGFAAQPITEQKKALSAAQLTRILNSSGILPYQNIQETGPGAGDVWQPPKFDWFQTCQHI